MQILSVLAISIGHFIDGTVLAYPSSAVPSLRNSTAISASEEDLDFISEFLNPLGLGPFFYNRF